MFNFSNKAWWLRESINDIQISIITDPLPIGKYFWSEYFKNKIRPLLKNVRKVVNPQPSYIFSFYKGHPSVTRSIVEGLDKLGIIYTYNPKHLKDLSQTVVVVSSLSAVKQMIALKQQGFIRRLIIGPNISADPGNHVFFSSPEVDRYITHAPLCSYITRVLPNLSHRCAPWAAGVDMDYWRPVLNSAPQNILIYSKQNKGVTDSLKPYLNLLRDLNFSVEVLIYGQYTKNQYLAALQRAQCMIGFTIDETQGIAFAEAWAVNVPTFIWYNSEPTYLGVAYKGSSAPYLTEFTGAFFRDLNEFRSLIIKWMNGNLEFSPRNWCEKNMSDESCTLNLLNICSEI